jgi:electron transfer flavoprotein beta subunit
MTTMKMKILTCVKQVPETDTPLKLDQETGAILSEEITAFKMNRLDEIAVEEAVRIKEQMPQTRIDAVSVGPQRAQEVVKRAMGMGADNGVHILTPSDPTCGPTATWIADFARNRAYDLILTGAMSEDRMQGMVGPMVAAHLGLPCASSVVSAQLEERNRYLLVERELEGGHGDILRLLLPAVVCLQSGTNRPRYPSLSNLLRANRQRLLVMAPFELPNPKPKEHEKVLEITPPQKTRPATVLQGTLPEKAAQLLAILQAKALIR